MQVPANPMTLQPMDVRGEALLKPAFEGGSESYWRPGVSWRGAGRWLSGQVECARIRQFEI